MPHREPRPRIGTDFPGKHRGRFGCCCIPACVRGARPPPMIRSGSARPIFDHLGASGTPCPALVPCGRHYW
jgi:hypothetical protein